MILTHATGANIIEMISEVFSVLSDAHPYAFL